MRTIAPHGNRTRYIHRGCRCGPCREANRVYSVERRRQFPHPNALVSAKAVKRHLRLLGRRGVGLRAVRDVTGLNLTRLLELRSGNAGRVTRRTERLILNVTSEAYADAARIPGKRTICLIKRMKRQGFNYRQLALKLDLWPETLQRIVKRKGNVLAKTQMKVERFYNRLMAEAAA